MAQIRVRPKHQITIPARIARMAGIKVGDCLEVGYTNGVVTLSPSGHSVQPKSLMAYAGIAHGAWGQTLEDFERALTSERASWER